MIRVQVADHIQRVTLDYSSVNTGNRRAQAGAQGALSATFRRLRRNIAIRRTIAAARTSTAIGQ